MRKVYGGVNNRDEDGALGHSVIPVVHSRGYYRYSVHLQKGRQQVLLYYSLGTILR